jgi:hypothetical protein
LKQIREIAIWATLIATGLLAALSAIGAGRGAEAARRLFNSAPLGVFWVLFSALFILGLVVFKRLRHSPGLLGIHGGCLLILVGSMWASRTGHDLANRLLDSKKVRAGYMQIPEGRADSVVRDEYGQQILSLPFRVGLEDFWIEYYETDRKWILYMDAPPVGDTHQRRQRIVPWGGTTGTDFHVPFTGMKILVFQYIPWMDKESYVPFTGATFTMLQYIDKAKPVFVELDQPHLEISDAGSETFRIPVEIGRKVALPSGRGSITMAQTYTHLTVQGGKAVNVDGSDANPAVRVEIEKTDGTKVYDYGWSQPVRMRGHGMEGLSLRYVTGDLAGAEASPTSTVPGMEVLLTYRGKSLQRWLFGRDPKAPLQNVPFQLSLASLLDSKPHVDAHGHKHMGPALVTVKPRGPIRDFHSRLVVLEEGKRIGRKVIELNDPLHYDGYHFYQHAYDPRHGHYTVLRVVSDSGLLPVYAGFVLLCAGTFWLFWVQPAWAYFVKRRDHGA